MPWPEQELLFASARDTTHRRRAEAEIAKLAAFPRLNPSPVLEFAADGTLSYYNEAAQALARHAGLAGPAGLLPEDSTRIVRECLARGQGLAGRESRAGGRLLSWTFHPATAAGVVHGYATDVTEQRQSEDRIREQAALLDQASDAIVVRDLTHRVLYWNRAAERIFGWRAEEAIGRSALELQRDGDPSLEALRHTLARGEWRGELRHATRTGGMVVVESRWTLLRDTEGQPKSLLILSTDITARRELETQFLRAQRLESIGTLASGIAHDLNNVLAPILMAVNLLEDSLPDAQDRRLVDVLRVSAQRGSDMVRQILSFTRGQGGTRTRIQLRPLVLEVTRILRETFPRTITLEPDLPGDLWPALADTTQVHQVLMNLCLNARDAMPEGGRIEIVLDNILLEEKHRTLQPDARPGRYVRLCVRDTGAGIPPEALDRIWDPFFSLKPQDQGTGLGLSTVAAIVRNHGGFVHVESSPGCGALFETYWPACADEATPVPVPIASGRAGQGETLLVIDDEQAFQELVRAICQRHGYRVLTASDGSEAIALFARRQEDIQLVLTDVVMPCLDGPGTIRALRQMRPDLPIIATSGLTAPEALDGAEACPFLLKPFTSEELLLAIDRALHPGPAQP
jgi:PAS domain S-box-containing protein